MRIIHPHRTPDPSLTLRARFFGSRPSRERQRPVLPAVLLSLLLTPCPTHALEPLDAEGLSDALATLLDTHPAARRTTLTLKVVDLETGEVLFDRGGDKLLTPASNLKIYTSAAALALLGPEYRWTTGIYLPRFRGSPDDPESQAVILNVTGDPMLDTEQLASLVRALAKKHPGLPAIEAVGMNSPKGWHAVPLKGPGWMWDDDPDYYNMSIRAGMLNFNVVKVRVTPDGNPVLVPENRVGAEVERNVIAAMPGGDPPRHVHVHLEPPASYPSVPEGSSAKGLVGPEARSDFAVTRRPFEHDLRISGHIKPDDQPVEAELTVHDPAEWIPAVMSEMLEESALDVELTQPTLQHHGFETRNDVEQQGKSLAEAVRHFLKKSENAVGEMVLLKLAETFGEDHEVSWPSGAKVITDWLVNEAGLEAGSFRLVDGSGLSRYNLISADSSVKLLAFMKTHEHFEPFFDGLPVYEVKLPAGETFRGVPVAEFDAERVFAKPGGMSGVSTISGYLQTLDGRWLAFSFLGNGYIGGNEPVREVRDALWAELVRYDPAEVPAGGR